MPNQAPSEDGEPTSVVETVKNLFKKNKKIIIGGGTALVLVTGVFISLAKGQGVTQDIEDFEPSPDPVAEGQKRQSPCEHEVSAYERMTKYGVQSVRSYSRGGSTAEADRAPGVGLPADP
ncbi:hypothetical protein [Streptomyces prasinus]|uniref:hypothetical protein n=1 Tax=Streptomyces prasinus TaxID=67345 RepID=UPI0006EB6894|nr:hypothetical protein [Streptomyces prasinus]